MLDLINMTAGDLSALINDDAGGNTYSTRFGKSVYGTIAFNLGKYKSQQKHLLDVLDSVEDSRPLRDILVHEENPAQILEILAAIGAEDEVKQAYTDGEEAWTCAISDGFGVSAACAKSAAAMRRATIYGKQSDDSDREAAA